jgi:hypothetical protein
LKQGPTMFILQIIVYHIAFQKSNLGFKTSNLVPNFKPLGF